MERQNERHVVLLTQIGPLENRSYSDFESINACIDGIIQIFESYLKYKGPELDEIKYGLGDMLRFIDMIEDMACFVYNEKANMYAPYTRKWIKERLYEKMLKDNPEPMAENEDFDGHCI